MLSTRIEQLLDRQGKLIPLPCAKEMERDFRRRAAQPVNCAPGWAVRSASIYPPRRWNP